MSVRDRMKVLLEATKKPAKEADGISLEAIAAVLKSMHTKTGGSMRNVRIETGDYPTVTAEPSNRQRLDHYVGKNYRPGPDEDPEGWDEEGWESDYAGPLSKEVTAALAKHFDMKKLYVDVDEKGFIGVQIPKPKS